MPPQLRRTTLFSKASQGFLLLILWLTRIAGAVFIAGSLGFLVLAWVERSIGPVVMALIPMSFGAFAMSVRLTPDGAGLEYGILRRRL
jgi:hypothetical protein